MSPVIRVSDETFERLQSIATPFTDKPGDVIERLLDSHQAATSADGTLRTSVVQVPEREVPPIASGERPTIVVAEPAPEGPNGLIPIGLLVQRNLAKRKPSAVEIDGTVTTVRNWGDLCEVFVAWLADHQRLYRNHLPIMNHSGRDKYFVNATPEHADARKDGNWREARGFYVDIKYSASGHIRNLIAAMEQLGDPVIQVRIALR
ncbi:MAG: hypothetical protein HOH43_28085 [Candidatus Latescibacteria bacterium]|nr:hypothetical protein [Candidatus Latescibacterota bacterium]